MSFMKRGGPTPIDYATIKRDNPLPGVVSASGVKILKSGAGFKACCPFHPDRSPSLSLYHKNGEWAWKCFGCGESGDVIDWVEKTAKVPQKDAVAMLCRGRVPSVHVAPLPPANSAHNGNEARKIWAAAHAIAGTPAEKYLRRRNIDIGLPDCLRFDRLWFAGELRPMLIAAVAGPDNRVQAIHRIVLKDDGTKADLNGGRVKFSLGPVMGGAIRLTGSGNGMLVCAGIEDGLTLLQQQAQAVWAVTSDVALRAVQLPAGVRSVVVAHDSDETGKSAGKEAADRLAGEGRQVRLIQPLPPFKDFNEEIAQ